MKPYQDKITKKWKWGTRGVPKYDSKEECARKELEVLTDRLNQLRNKINSGYINNGI